MEWSSTALSFFIGNLATGKANLLIESVKVIADVRVVICGAKKWPQ